MGNDSHIDFDTCTLHGVLRQIRYVKQDVEEENPLLLKCHVTTFPANQTKMMVNYLKSFPHDKFPSIKRFQKLSSDHTKLRAVICPTDYKSQEDINADLTALFKSSALFTLEELDIPCALPKSKEMAIKWSDKFWPMAWKGNPNHQFLKSLNLDPQMERQMITQLLDSYRLINNKSPAIVRSVTMIARETKDGMMKMLHVAEDNRQTHPLSHSVMNAIKAIWKWIGDEYNHIDPILGVNV
ncbi:tRNA-specific adenosine deaminase subunit tad3 [Scheffersomyces spartinae]|uniref:tRNA-specific adenosine deaminase subunit tad3 n=1 Tax=Scheffersomyces spartinae TaxID=45513 RepID=A0A9P7V9H7_9ASCO|nr:tRNA-specific adenosine deaminase subunit tad3 [Scheffersomyces spartinae]KAG7193842.1 tRNA-specific adenosine deaminase subunit tad3 [Scheffersomyces spartinae]